MIFLKRSVIPGGHIPDRLRYGVDPERPAARHFPDHSPGMQILEQGSACPIRHPEGDGSLGGRQAGNGDQAVDQRWQPGGGAPPAGALQKTPANKHEIGMEADVAFP